jgi:hypothetical protein
VVTSGASYPSAREVAIRIQSHFRRHVAAGDQQRPSELPDVGAMESLIDAAFWASLRREEGYIPRVSLALLPPERVARPLLFESPLPLNPSALVKVAPAVERPGIHLGVWPLGDELRMWGTTRTVPPFSFVLEVAAPGLLVVKHHREGVEKFVNVAVLEGDQVKVIDEAASTLPDCPPLLTTLLGFDVRRAAAGELDTLVQLAVSMRVHGRGGSLLIVPESSDSWRESIVNPISYSIRPPFSELSDLLHRTEADARGGSWRDAVSEAVHAVAGLTAVDGATVLTDRFDLVAFGAKIARRRGSPLVERVAVTEPVEGSVAEVVHPTRLGGTRHLSAAQFVHDQNDALALVASQDGRFTVFAWSPCETIVHAHRVETLLL